MANELTLARQGVQRAKAFDAIVGEDDALGAGIGPGFARVTYRGGKWGVKYQGKTTMARRYIERNGQLIDDGPNDKLDVVILKVARKPSKYYYKGAFSEETTKPPDCWSTNGITPDQGAPDKQSPTCAGCRWNAFGSAPVRSDGTPSKGKACTDHKRLAVVPANDIENRQYGGPMLLLVPPKSLAKLPEYEGKLARLGYRHMEVQTQITFEEETTYPLMEFDGVRALSEQEAALVLKMREDPLVERILNVEVVGAEGYEPTDETAQQSAPPQQQRPTPPPVKEQPKPAAPPPPDDLSPPAHLRRAPEPKPDVPRETPAPAPAAVPNVLAMLSPEQIAALTPAQLQALAGGGVPQAEKPKRRTGPRTPQVSPREMDTTPQAANSNQPNGADEGDDGVDAIMGKIEDVITQTT